MIRALHNAAGLTALWIAAWLACATAWAQPPDGGHGPPPRREPPPARDPTLPSPSLREAMEAAQPSAPGAGPALAALPPLSLKARIVGRSRDPVALLGLGEKGSLVVHAGREYPLSLPGGSGYTLQILSISAQEVEVEVLPLKRRFILQ